MKQSKVYNTKKNGVHVCYKGSLYGYGSVTPDTKSAIDPSKQAEVGTFEGDVLGVFVKQGDVTESWPFLLRYVDSAPKVSVTKVPKEKKVKEPKVPKEPKKRTAVEWKVAQAQMPDKPPMELYSAERLDGALQRIREAAPSEQALGILEACWTNWQQSDRRLPLFQSLNYKDAVANEKIQILGRELIAEFSGAV